MKSNYLESIERQFKYYKRLGDSTFEQLENENIHWQFNQESNSIAVIVKHLVGNMLSRWTNFRNEDGEKKWRKRDSEFIDTYVSKKEMILAWEKGWELFLKVLNTLEDKDLTEIIYIRNQGHTILEAINRQLCHYSYHVGQIVFIGKLIKGDRWISLSIPKNQSSTYNSKKFSKERQRGHFTDDLLSQ